MEALPDAGRENPRDMIDLSEMTSRHVWSTQPAKNVNFRNLVEESPIPRTDMLQYRAIAQVDAQKAKDTFSLIGNGVCLFKIPETLHCDRTFARGSDDAYYLDAMDEFLTRENEELRIEDIPLLQRSLDSHSFCAFSKRHDYFREHMERRRIQRWIPSHAYETRHFSDMQLAESFPKVEQCISDVSQPAALPVSNPFVSYYYHLELRKCQGRNCNELTEREKRLLYCLLNEHYVLLVASWWKEAAHGGRLFVLDSRTVDVLQVKCAGITNIVGKPFPVIIEHMRSSAAKPENYHNWMAFEGDEMEESAFIWARNGAQESMPGEFDPYEACGRTLYCSLKSRRITRRPFTSATFRRSRSLLDKTVTFPDLERVPGLVTITENYGWNRHGNIKLSHLLENLVNLHNCTNGILDNVAGRCAGMSSAGRRESVQNVRPEDRCMLVEPGADSYDRPSRRDLVPYNPGPADRHIYQSREQRNECHDEQQHDNYDESSRYHSYDPYNGYYGYNYREQSQHYRSYAHSRQYVHDERNGYDEIQRGMAEYQDLDNPRNNGYGHQEKMSGETYRRTHDPITNVQVDVFTDGNRTPAGGNATSAHMRSSAQDELHASPYANGNKPEQARGCQTMRDIEPTNNSTPATPRNAPESVRHLLSRNGHALLALSRETPKQNRNDEVEKSIRSDVTRNTDEAVTVVANPVTPNCDMEKVDNVPTGNFPWLYQDSLKRTSEDGDGSSSDENAKRARLENQDVTEG